MKFSVISKVYIEGIGTITHEHAQNFDDSSNVFGRASEYRQYMRETFPNCKFELVKAKEIDK